MMRIFILQLIVIFGVSAQDTNTQIKLTGAFSLRDTKLLIYQDSVIAADILIEDKATYSSPEDVLRSELSANTKSWFDHVYLPGTKNTTDQEIEEKRKYLSGLTCKLLHKLSFTLNGTQTCFIKGAFYYNGSPSFTACLNYQKIEGRWFRIHVQELQELNDVVWRLKGDKLTQLLLGKNSGNIIVDGVIARTKTEFGFDYFRFLKIVEEWEESDNQEMIKLFLEW